MTDSVIKAAVVLLADTDTPEGMGRMANALTTARELKEEGDEVKVIFDGAGTKWAAELADGHKYSELLDQVRDKVEGACAYCANAYQVTDQVEAAGIDLIDDFDGHPSLRGLIRDGYRILTF